MPSSLKGSASALEHELYKSIAWPLYRIFGHAFDAFKVMVADDSDAIFPRLKQDRGSLIKVLTPEVKAKDSSSSPPTGVGQLLLQQDTQDTTAFRKQLQDLNPEDLKALKSRFRRKTARIVLRIRGIDNFRGSSATALAQILNMDESEVARMAESISGLYQQRL